jgi:hypothetical protein
LGISTHLNRIDLCVGKKIWNASGGLPQGRGKIKKMVFTFDTLGVPKQRNHSAKWLKTKAISDRWQSLS